MSDIHEDPSCDVAHGRAAAPPDDKVLVAVFATPVARFLLSYGADAGYRTVLVEPDRQRAKEAAAGRDDAGGPGAGGDGTGQAGVTGAPDSTEIIQTLDGPGANADVVVTDHHRPELGVMLRDALASPARWIGIMGNPRHEAPHIAALAALGVPDAEIRRVHRPIGINIGSRTPPEIAISALAGLIADRNGKPGGFAF